MRLDDMSVAIAELFTSSGSRPHLKITPLLTAVRPIAVAVCRVKTALWLRRDRPVVLLNGLSAAPRQVIATKASCDDAARRQVATSPSLPRKARHGRNDAVIGLRQVGGPLWLLMALGPEIEWSAILSVKGAAPYRAIGLRLTARHGLYPPTNSPSVLVVKDAVVQLIVGVLPTAIAGPLTPLAGCAPPLLKVAAGFAIFALGLITEGEFSARPAVKLLLIALLRLLAARPPPLLTKCEGIVCAVTKAESADLAATPPSRKVRGRPTPKALQRIGLSLYRWSGPARLQYGTCASALAGSHPRARRRRLVPLMPSISSLETVVLPTGAGCLRHVADGHLNARPFSARLRPATRSLRHLTSGPIEGDGPYEGAVSAETS